MKLIDWANQAYVTRTPLDETEILVDWASRKWDEASDFSTEAAGGGNSPLARVPPPPGNGPGYHRPGK